MMVGRKRISRSMAVKIADAINNWSGSYKEIISADEVLKLDPVKTYERDGCLVLPYQWGDVTLLALVNGTEFTFKYVTW